MVRIEQVVKYFQPVEEERNVEISEFLRAQYGKDIKEVALDPLYEFMTPRLNSANANEYHAMYQEMIRLKWDIDDGNPPIDYSSTQENLVLG